MDFSLLFPFKNILTWYQQNGRHNLPWRQVYNMPTKDRLYRVWIAEVMLQQTQVDRVIAYYNRFLGKYPTIESLAETTYDELFPYYQGLGYYGRARRMIELAKMVVEKYDWIFPDDFEKLRKLPGIGKYTAQALLAFGYDKPVLAMDANLEKIFARYYFGDRYYFKGKLLPLSPWDVSAEVLTKEEGGRKSELREGGLVMGGKLWGWNMGGLQLWYDTFVSQLENQLLSSISSKQKRKPPLPPFSGGREINNALMDFGALASTSMEKLNVENYPLLDCVWFQTNWTIEEEQKAKSKKQKDGLLNKNNSNKAPLWRGVAWNAGGLWKIKYACLVFLHENHKVYFSSHAHHYEPFLIEPTNKDDRRTVQDYFSVTYGLEVSVRPSFGSGYLTPGLSNLNPLRETQSVSLSNAGAEQPIKLFHAQIQTGKFDGRHFQKDRKEEWQKNNITSHQQ